MSPNMRIFNYEILKLHKNRAKKNIHNLKVIFDQIDADIFFRLSCLKLNFEKIFICNLQHYDFIKKLKNIYKDSSISYILSDSITQPELENINEISSEYAKNIYRNQENKHYWNFKSTYLPQKQDLIISYLYLQHINDIKEHLAELYRSLNKNGCLLLIFIGGNSLQELRKAINITDSHLGLSSPKFFHLLK